MADFIPVGDAQEIPQNKPAPQNAGNFIPASDAVEPSFADRLKGSASGAINSAKEAFGLAVGDDSVAHRAKLGVQAPAGIVESVWSGQTSLINSALSGVTALAKATADKVFGGDFQQTFSREFQRSSAGVTSHFNYEPQTESGRLVNEAFGALLEKGIKAAGEVGYQAPHVQWEKGPDGRVQAKVTQPGNPIAGAAGETIATAATLLLGPKGAKGEKPRAAPAPEPVRPELGEIAQRYRDPNAVTQYASQRYPETVKNIAASAIGRTARDVQQAQGPALDRDVFGTLHKNMDAELNIKPEDSGRTPLREKLVQYIDKLDPTGQVNVSDRGLIADSLIAQFKELNKLANRDKSPEELVASRLVRPKQTVQDFINRRLNIQEPPTAAESASRAKAFQDALDERQGWVIDPTTGVERPMTAGDYLAMTTRDVGKPKTAREIVEEQTKGSSRTAKEQIELITGVTQDTTPASKASRQKAVREALKAPSGIWVSDPRTGTPERQLTMGEYHDTYWAGKQASGAKQLEVWTQTERESRTNRLKQNQQDADQFARDRSSGSERYEDIPEPGPRAKAVRSGGARGLSSFVKGSRGIQKGALYDAAEVYEQQARRSAEALKQVSVREAQAGAVVQQRGREDQQRKEYSFEKTDAIFEKSRNFNPEEGISKVGKAANLLADRTLDSSGRVKWKLESSGALGRDVKDKFSLIRGSSSRAQQRYDFYSKDIWSDLSRGEVDTLDKVIRSRRIIQIDKYRGEGTVAHEGGLTGTKAGMYLRDLKGKIGEDNFNKLDNRASRYFKAYQEQLNDLHDAGLISDESFLRMYNLEYSPTEVVRLMDPELSYNFHGQKVSVSDSGVRYTEKGQSGPVRLDSKLLLAESVLRTQSRIMKNDANVALREFAEKNPNQDWVQVPKFKGWNAEGKADGVPDAPFGWTRIDSMYQGKQHPIFMRNDMAEQWVLAPSAMTGEFANVVRLLSGTSVVKTFATTYNPAFAITNLPRDLASIWIASGEYSGTLPKYALQMGTDMLTVLPDALRAVTTGPKRKFNAITQKEEFTDRYGKFVEQGGGMDFMTHQGRSLWGKDQIAAMENSGWKTVSHALSAVNEFSEIWTRLALRERALKNGKSEAGATASAREYMDFSLSGQWVKGADTAVPYLNATVQAFNAAGKQAARDPKRFAWQMAQVFGATISAATAMALYNKETWDQIPNDQKVNNLIIGPRDMYIMDPEGNKRNVYFKLKLDSPMVPMNALAVALVEKNINGKVPDGIMWNTMKGTISQLGTLPIPSVSAFASYAANYDFWKGSPIWHGDKRKPEDEVRQPYQPNATPQIWVDMGKALGFSPERARDSFTQLVPSNLWTDLIGGGYGWAMSGMTDYDKARSTEQMLAQLPGVSRVVSLTHPAATELDRIDSTVREVNSQRGIQNDAIRGMIFREQHGEGRAIESFRAWIQTQPPEDRERLTDRFRKGYAVERAFETFKPSEEGLPSRSWWMQTAGANPKARGELFYQEWVSRDEEGRRHMMRMAEGMERYGVGYASDDFRKAFKVERNRWGDGQR